MAEIGSAEPMNGTTVQQINITHPYLPHYFQPAVYYITVEAITASGQNVRTSSNGVVIDTTPPQLVRDIEHYDVLFSEDEPTRFQASNDTISAQWRFRDLESGIVEYLWSIGSYPSGEDIQGLESTGTASQAVNRSLSGLLRHNTTYYISVIARNGAGLNASATSSGITVIEMELNGTQLQSAFQVAHTDVLVVTGENGTVGEVLITDNEQRAAVSWRGISSDIEEICECPLEAHARRSDTLKKYTSGCN